MSSSSSPNLVLELRRPWLRHLPTLLLLAVALSLPWLASALPLVVRVMLVVAASGSATLSLWLGGFGRQATQLVSLTWDQDHRWQLQFREGKAVTVNLLSRSWYSPWVMCLKFTAETGRAYQLLLWRGELTPTAWQQWQLRLRLEGGRGTTNSDMGAAF